MWLSEEGEASRTFHVHRINGRHPIPSSLQLQARSLALDAADDDVAGVLGDDLIVVEHGEFYQKKQG